MPLFWHRVAEKLPEPSSERWLTLKRHDVAWLLFILILIFTAPETSYQALIILPVLGIFQIVEPRLKFFASRRGQVISVTLKLILSYLLVGWTHGIDSYYQPIFFIPVVSAASTFELLGVVVVTVITWAAQFSFLFTPYIYYRSYSLSPEQLAVMSVQATLYGIVAFAVYEQARAKREEIQHTQEAAERLAESNRSLREAQASLRRSERLAALGQLTAGLAHELRNPLGTIKASAEMLTKGGLHGRPEVMAEMAGYITSEVDRMNGLVSRFLDFARPLRVHPVTADLQPIIDDVIRQQIELAKNRSVTISERVNTQPFSFEFDPDLLKVALSNLVQNAIQASEAGQSVEIRADMRDEDVMIFVSDHGDGIQPQHLENIFNPFFTTKTQGVGLGLAIVAKIVDEHRGHMNVFSEADSGTRFEMTLPKKQQQS